MILYKERRKYKSGAFKTCPNCKHIWPTLEAFLADPLLDLAGYQVHTNDLEGGLFFFTHHQEGCFTTLSIPVTAFLSLNNSPLLAKRDEQHCIGSEFCVHQDDLSPRRPVKCECIWVREILKTIKERQNICR